MIEKLTLDGGLDVKLKSGGVGEGVPGWPGAGAMGLSVVSLLLPFKTHIFINQLRGTIETDAL